MSEKRIPFMGRRVSFHRDKFFVKFNIGRHPDMQDKPYELRLYVSFINNGDGGRGPTIMLTSHECSELFLFITQDKELNLHHGSGQKGGRDGRSDRSLKGSVQEDHRRGTTYWLNIFAGEEKRSFPLSIAECFELAQFIRAAIDDMHNGQFIIYQHALMQRTLYPPQ